MAISKTRRLMAKICVLIGVLIALVGVLLAVVVLLLPEMVHGQQSAQIITRVTVFIICVGGGFILYKLAKWLTPDLWG
ncbi:MAG TPA: hypothetical protein VMT98_01165 [Verrucomicrobiae bacterium]|nr:hypothetical protein [Verrucomicrobiae bacterium]